MIDEEVDFAQETVADNPPVSVVEKAIALAKRTVLQKTMSVTHVEEQVTGLLCVYQASLHNVEVPAVVVFLKIKRSRSQHECHRGPK
jgi:hypothetical protein